MNIAIIGSGGDGAGMNQCLYELCKRLKDHNIKMFYRGYQGLIDDKTASYTLNQLKQGRKKGGLIIKSSRSPEFMIDKGFNKAIKTLKYHQIDLLVIMGGNGSLKGAKKLVDFGINCIFIPTTIDNDIEHSDYSIGHDTAINNAVDFVNKVDTSMQAFDRLCIYEVMGRHCPDIANDVAKITKADFCYTSASTMQNCLKQIKRVLKSDLSPKIILQENVVNSDKLSEFLKANLKNIDIKVAVVGYVQRGGFATKKELQMATNFAKHTCNLIKNKTFNKIVCYKQNKNKFEAINI